MTSPVIATRVERTGLPLRSQDRLRRSLQRELTAQVSQAAECRATTNELTGQSDVDSVLEREIAETSYARAEGAAADILDALARLDGGTYGVCERCDGAIPIERLEAIPHARHCVACSQRGTGLFG